jgi:hypothetical protein
LTSRRHEVMLRARLRKASRISEQMRNGGARGMFFAQDGR